MLIDKSKAASIFYNCLICYFWFVVAFVSYTNDSVRDADPYKGTGYRYYLLITPLIIYLAVNCRAFFSLRLDRKRLAVLLYVVVASALSLGRWDPKTVVNVAALGLPLIIVLDHKVVVSAKMINVLFLISIVAVVIQHEPGVSRWGYLPGQTIGNLDEGLWWRISIWEYCTPPFSAVFALIVLISNYFYNNSRPSRYVFYALSLYFIGFSGSRTTLMVLFVGGALIFLTRVIEFRQRTFYKIFPGIVLILSYGMLFFPVIISFMPIQSEFVRGFLFRGAESQEELKNNIARPMIIGAQLKIFADNYMIGAGTEGLRDQYESETSSTAVEGTVGSDALITFLLARDGLALSPLVFFVYLFFCEATQRRDLVMYLVLLVLVIFASTYGGFLNFMSPMFLMLVGLLYQTSYRHARGMYVRRV